MSRSSTIKTHVKPLSPKEYPKGEIVWIKCRATKNCKGNQAEVVRAQDATSELGYGGRMSGYRCMTCKRVFFITV